MSNELATTSELSVIEQIVVNGDIKALSPEQRVVYYNTRCEAAGLDPRTQPFSYITLQGKLTLYATKTATEQLCEKRKLSCEIVQHGMIGDLYQVQARCTGPDGRHTDNIGVVTAGHLKGDPLANAMMKAVTKSYRRAVLAHCGLGMLDETEAETIDGAKVLSPEDVKQLPQEAPKQAQRRQPAPAPQAAAEPAERVEVREIIRPDELVRYNQAREFAISMGYRTKDGAEPKPLDDRMPVDVIRARGKKWIAWIEEQEEKARQSAQAPVVEGEVKEPVAA